MTEEARAKQREYNRQYAAAHKEQIAAQQKAWKDANKDHVREYNRKWKADHAEHLREYREQYWERKAAADENK